MKVKYTFRRRNWSNYLVEYAAKKALKLKKYESNHPFQISVTFMDDRHERTVNVLVESDGDTFTAKARTDDYFDAIDSTFEKVTKQIEKKKTKTKSSKMRRLKSQKANLQAMGTLRRKAA